MNTSLRGKRVLVTRPSHQGDAFVSELQSLGATPLHVPVIKVVKCVDSTALRSVVEKLSEYEWVIFTSVNGVKIFVESLSESELKTLKECKLAAVGSSSAAVLEELVKRPDAVPTEFVSDAVSDALPGDIAGKKILFARAKQARKVLADSLRDRQAIVDELELYDVEIVCDESVAQLVKAMEKPDFLTFTSSSTVRGLEQILKRNGQDWLATVPAVCIGPITAKTLEGFGVKPYAVASVYTVDGILDVLRN